MIRIFLFFFLFSNLIFSQEKLTQCDMSYAYGSVIKHKLNMGHLVTKRPHLYQLSWSKTSDTTSQWKKHFNYPDVGISLWHQNFENDILGQNIGLSYFTDHYLLNRNAKHQLNLVLGFGLSLFDTHFNFDTNNKNSSVSSALTYNQYLKIKYVSPIILKHFSINTGITFSHFSNASFYNPNNGINSVFAHIGLQYIEKQNFFKYPSRVKSQKTDASKLQLATYLRLGYHETYPGLGTRPVGTLGFKGLKKIRKMASVQSGIELFCSLDAKEKANFMIKSGYNASTQYKDFKKIGLFVGFEQFFDSISIDGNIGYYVYDPLKFEASIYEHLNMNYRFNHSRFSAGLGLKTHFFKADHAYFSIQYQIIP